jgi:hypothetical protein
MELLFTTHEYRAAEVKSHLRSRGQRYKRRGNVAVLKRFNVTVVLNLSNSLCDDRVRNELIKVLLEIC